MFRLPSIRLPLWASQVRNATSVRSFSSVIRYAEAAPAGIKEPKLRPYMLNSENRDSLKRLDSRKTYLVDRYTYFLDNYPVILFVHFGNMTKNDNNALRSQIGKTSAKLSVLRNNLFKVALRGHEYEDPASKEVYKAARYNKHPLLNVFGGPTAAILIPEVDPATVKTVLQIISKMGDRVFLQAARIDGQVMNVDEVQQFKDLPSKEGLLAQLMGTLSMLGAAGLVRTLQAPSQMMYLTLSAHEQNQIEKQNEKKNEEQ